MMRKILLIICWLDKHTLQVGYFFYFFEVIIKYYEVGYLNRHESIESFKKWIFHEGGLSQCGGPLICYVMYILVYIYQYLCIGMHVLACMYWNICIGMHVLVCKYCKYILVCMYWYVCSGMYVLVCMYWYVCIGMYALLYMFWYICTGMYVLICMQ